MFGTKKKFKVISYILPALEKNIRAKTVTMSNFAIVERYPQAIFFHLLDSFVAVVCF